MAVPVIAFDGTRVSAAENTTDGGTWDKWQAVQAPSVEPDFFYQGVASLSNKVGTTAAGVEMDNSTGTHDMSSPDQIWLAKVNATNYQALNPKGTTGMILYIGSANLNHQYRYYVHGNDTYPLAGGWVFIPIDPNIAGYRDFTLGTPDLNNIDYWAVSCDFSATSKSENVMMDAIDIFDSGTGLTLTRGDGQAPASRGSFQKFADADEGTAGNRWGIIRTIDGIFYVIGVLTVGDNLVETDFTDTGKVVVFVDGRCGAGWCGLDVDTRQANSVFTCLGVTFIGRGTKSGTADTRPDYDIIGPAGSGASCTFTLCAFREWRQFLMSDGCTIDRCVMSRGGQVVQNGGIISGCQFDNTQIGDGNANVLSDDPTRVFDSTWEFSNGHAIEMDTTGTYDFDGNKFTGYGADESTDAAIHNSSGGLITLNIGAGGDTAPTVRNTGGSTTVLNITVGLIIRVRQQDGTILGAAQCAIYDASDDTELMNEDSDGGTGDATQTFAYPGSDVAVYIRVRKSSTGQRYIPNSTTATITSTGLDVTVVMAEDDNVDL